ncbi:MAG: hypothetical protein ACYDDU_08030 [Dermatophilaceae bacterium]
MMPPTKHAKPGADQPQKAQRGRCVIAGVRVADDAQQETDEQADNAASDQERREPGRPADLAGGLDGLLTHDTKAVHQGSPPAIPIRGRVRFDPVSVVGHLGVPVIKRTRLADFTKAL